MTTTSANAPPIHVQLIPLRAFHIDQGQGRTVAVLFRMAVDHHRTHAGSSDQRTRDQQTKPSIGALK